MEKERGHQLRDIYNRQLQGGSPAEGYIYINRQLQGGSPAEGYI